MIETHCVFKYSLKGDRVTPYMPLLRTITTSGSFYNTRYDIVTTATRFFSNVYCLLGYKCSAV